MFRTTLLAVCLLSLAACGNQPVAPPADAGTDSPDASCPYPCGQACCTKNQTCDFSTETCSDKCAPDCFGRSCGSDGCGGQCGFCDPGTVCNEAAGKCVACTRVCDGKQCGSDQCGDSCGTCDPGFACAADFLCWAAAPMDAGTSSPDTGGLPGTDASLPTGDDAGAGAEDSGSANPGLDAGVSPGLDAGGTPGLDAGGNTGLDASGSAICTPPAPTYDSNFTAAQFCDRWSRVVCDRLAQCCILSPAAYDGCLQSKIKECDTQDVTARIQAGTVTVDLAAARACFDAERARQVCDGTAYVMMLPACDVDRIFSAHAAPGAKCYRDSDCAGGRCQRTPSTCDGVCVAYTPIGSPCGPTALCDPATSRCQSGACQAKVATGGTCVDTGGCLQSAYCDAAKVCVARHGLGGDCVDGSQCEMQLDCIGGSCRESYSTPLGAPCKANSNCALGSWCKGYSAGVTGTCVAYLSAGQACTLGTSVECGPEQYCLSGTCTPRVGVGGACAGAQCVSGLTCSSSKCVAMGDVGSPCTSDALCRRYLRCAGTPGTCTDALASAGESCSYTPQCASAYCLGATNVCTPLVPDGQTCTTSNNPSCASGNCETNAGVWACRPKCTY